MVVVWWWCGGGVVVVWWWCGGSVTIYKTHSKFLLFREFFQPLFPKNQSSRDCMAGRGWCAMLHAWHGACVLSSYQKQLKLHCEYSYA